MTETQTEMDEIWSRPVARHTDPATSHMAAERAALTASKSRMLVLRLLSERPMTDFELAAASGKAQTSIGVRRGECAKHGLVEKALDGRGEEVTRPSPSGSDALVWQVTPAGRAFYAEHGG